MNRVNKEPSRILRLDQDIYSKLCARDESGLRLLYSNYSDALYGMAYRILGSRSFAEDALQQSFLKIWNNIEQYDPERSTLFTWMARIVKNTSIDIKRLKSFQNEQRSETIDANVHTRGSSETDTSHIDAVNMIDGLDEKYAFVIEYLYLRGYTQKELSDEFDIPIGTIKTRVKKGIEILRSKLDKEKKLFLGSFTLSLIIILLLLWI